MTKKSKEQNATRKSPINFSLFTKVSVEDFKDFKSSESSKAAGYSKMAAYIATFTKIMSGISIEFTYPIDIQKGTSLSWRPMHKEARSHNRWVLFYNNGVQEITASQCTYTDKLSFQPHLEEFLVLVLKTLQNHKSQGA